MHNQKKDNNKFKNKKQPELTENQTVWKSDNQGVKEETFIQSGRRGGNRQPGREDLRQGSAGGPGWARLWLAGKEVDGRSGKAADCKLGGPTFECR